MDTAARVWPAFILAAAVGWAEPGTASAAPSTMPGKDDVRNAAAVVGDYYRIAKPCPAGSCEITNKWDDAVLMMGIIEHWRKHKTAAYKAYAENWARKNSWTLYSDLSGDQQNPGWDNRMTAGYTYLRLLQAGSAGASVANVTTNLNNQLALKLTPERQGLIDYVFPGQTKSSRSWKAVDANFMALPEWITMGKHAGKASYYARGFELQNYQVNVMGLRDPTSKLWYRDEAAKPKRSPDGKKIFWGRGNGWIAGALAIALSELPTSRPEYAAYRARFTELMSAVRTRQRADGFWNMNLADPNHYPAPETSATALFTFAMARGIALGILSGATYRPVAAKAWNAMVATAIRNDGFLGYCQGIGGAPVPPSNATYPDEDSTANFCVGAFLLAGAAMYDIAPAAGPSAAAVSGGAYPVTTYQAEALTTAVSSGLAQSGISSRYARGGRATSAPLRGAGDFVEFTVPDIPDGTYRLRVRFLRDELSGIWQLKADGVNAALPVDGYDVVPHYAEVDLGSVTFSQGPAPKRFRFEVTGKNNYSASYRIGIDSIALMAQ